MALETELEKYVKATFAEPWTTKSGRKVPETDDLPLNNQATVIEGTVLYADLADSTPMVKNFKPWFSAEVYKNYLHCAARLITHFGGVITAYDGDRVMGVFIETNRNTAAVKCGLNIAHVVENVINPAMHAEYTVDHNVAQRVGIDTSSLFIARTGIRGSNDLVWVGNAANNAAKMAALSTGYSTYITPDVYNDLDGSAQSSGSNSMWNNLGSSDMGYTIYGSNYRWDV